MADTMLGATPSHSSWLPWWAARPPWWFRLGRSLLSFLTALCLALVIMLQWLVWLIVTGNMIHPWGMALGFAVMLSQMFVIFNDRSAGGGSCALPKRGGGDGGGGGDSGRGGRADGPPDAPVGVRPTPPTRPVQYAQPTPEPEEGEPSPHVSGTRTG
jgi:hypothetical protein